MRWTRSMQMKKQKQRKKVENRNYLVESIPPLVPPVHQLTPDPRRKSLPSHREQTSNETRPGKEGYYRPQPSIR